MVIKNKLLFPILALIIVLIVLSFKKHKTVQNEEPLNEAINTIKEPEEIRIKSLDEEQTSNPKLSSSSVLFRYYNSDDFFWFSFIANE